MEREHWFSGLRIGPDGIPEEDSEDNQEAVGKSNQEEHRKPRKEVGDRLTDRWSGGEMASTATGNGRIGIRT